MKEVLLILMSHIQRLQHPFSKRQHMGCLSCRWFKTKQMFMK